MYPLTFARMSSGSSRDGGAQDIYDFMTLYLSLTPQQRRPFLVTISRAQCERIRQVFYNVLINKSIEISSEDRQYLLKHNASLRSLASRRYCMTVKKTLLVKKAPMLVRVFRIIHDYIDSERRRIAALPSGNPDTSPTSRPTTSDGLSTSTSRHRTNASGSIASDEMPSTSAPIHSPPRANDTGGSAQKSTSGDSPLNLSRHT